MADEDIEILDEMASYRRSMAGTGRVIAALERSGHPKGPHARDPPGPD
jgi:hypothetical protein